MSEKKEKKEKLEKTGLEEMTFAALNPYREANIPSLTEVEDGRSRYVYWGDNNALPAYYRELYETSDTLSSVINAIKDYVKGNDVEGADAEDIGLLAVDWCLFGCCALQVHRRSNGTISASYLNVANLRTDKDRQTFWYSEDFSKGYGRYKAVVYPRYMENSEERTSILYMRNDRNRTYGYPRWGSAVNAAEAERKLGEYHLNNISNGFSASYLINFNGGKPNDAIKQEIEDSINDKFSGSGNAGRIMVSFNQDKDHQADIQKLETEDFGAKMESLVKWCRTSILSKFRCSPQLVGVNLENIGFNSQEYAEAYALFNRTVIRPIQDAIESLYAQLGIKVMITPFSVELT